jgi:tripartite ATP-independent transporter DctM subunit
MPIGIVMAVVGFLGFGIIRNFGAAVDMLPPVTYSTFADYNLSVIPLFVLMGAFCFSSGISRELFQAANAFLGRFRGGLAMATIGACAAFAAISGSAIATTATMCTVALPEMRRYRYDDKLSSAAIAVGGGLGIMIPPSVVFIMYGILTQQSIGKLFIAGIIPGITQALFYMIAIYIVCKLNPKMGPAGVATTFAHKMNSLKNTWIVFALFLFVMGGLYIGIFSPTEAAAIGASGAFVFALARGKLNYKGTKESLLSSVLTTAMVFIIVWGAMILGYFLSVSRLPAELSNIVTALNLNRYVVIALILVIYFALGCVMDSLAMVLITVPVFYPLVMNLGFDPIWFGVIIVRVFEIGIITPPVGMDVFIVHGMAKDISLSTIFRGVVPFLIADFFHIILLVAIPSLSTFLPSLMK